VVVDLNLNATVDVVVDKANVQGGVDVQVQVNVNVDLG
jgi:hypothetical protein